MGLEHVSVVVVGVHDEEELKQDLAWARDYKPLTEEERAALDGPTRELARKWGNVYGETT